MTNHSPVLVPGGDTPGLTEAASAVAARLRRPSLAPMTVSLVAMAIDFVGLTLAFWFGAYLAGGPAFDAVEAASLAGLSGLAVIALLWTVKAYALDRLRNFLAGWAAVAGMASLVGAGGVAAGIWPAWSVALLPVLVVWAGRWLMASVAGWVLDSGLTERRAVIVGGGEEAARLIRGLAANPANDIRVCGLFDDRDDARSPQLVLDAPKLGTVREVLAFARLAEIDMLIIALPLTAERRIREILDQVKVLPVDVRLSSYSADLAFPRRSGAGSGLIDVLRRPLAGWRWRAKRAVDLVGACVALVLLAPLLIATAVAIRFETPGPIFFRQVRHGYNNRPIRVWKFRSMYADQCDPEARRIVTKGDPRVTQVGAVIRRWSIDELPQLFNVLRGELSLVGPRPHAVAAVSSRQQAFEEIVQGYAARHRVPPGVTGWAQVHGWRGEVDDPAALEARVAHDLYYIENWSLLLDLWILAITPLRLVDSKGAY